MENAHYCTIIQIRACSQTNNEKVDPMVLSSFCVYCMMMTWLTMMATTSSEPNATWKMNFYSAFVFHRHRFCQFLTNESWKSVVGAARSAKCKIASEETERLWKTANNCRNYRIEHTHTYTHIHTVYLSALCPMLQTAWSWTYLKLRDFVIDIDRVQIKYCSW